MTLRVAGVRFGGGAGRLRWGSGAAAVAAAYDPGVVALPLFPLGTVLLPGGDLPLTLFEPRYLELLRRLLDQPAADRVFGVIALRRGNEVGPNAALDLHDIGCAARITHVERAFPASRGIAIETVGTRRFRLHRLDTVPHRRRRVARRTGRGGSAAVGRTRAARCDGIPKPPARPAPHRAGRAVAPLVCRRRRDRPGR